MQVLIDTWWNVNLSTTDVAASVKLVLIDTWWNVNSSEQCCYSGANRVLIDTWWNVNSAALAEASALFDSFNRYMVECE